LYQNLTEFNTAHNKRIAQLVDISAASTGPNPVATLVKQKRKGVVFNDEEQIINPEDVDPTIGRFRNLVQTTVFIPNKVDSFFY
jgi:nuclear inhibitor of protein phosphatase 1